jgi:DNA-binding protein HU-beta
LASVLTDRSVTLREVVSRWRDLDPTQEEPMASLNKSDLAGVVASESGVTTSDAKAVIEKTFEVIARQIANGDEVSVSGFGKFSQTERSARQGRNPQTGETIDIPASKAPKFSAASQLKNAVKGA